MKYLVYWSMFSKGEQNNTELSIEYNDENKFQRIKIKSTFEGIIY